MFKYLLCKKRRNDNYLEVNFLLKQITKKQKKCNLLPIRI